MRNPRTTSSQMEKNEAMPLESETRQRWAQTEKEEVKLSMFGHE